jgi:hypothetical protein
MATLLVRIGGKPLKEMSQEMSVQESMLPANQAFVVQFRSKLNMRLGQFQGRAEHVASGKVIHFSSQQELFDFIVGLLKQAPVDSRELED